MPAMDGERTEDGFPALTLQGEALGDEIRGHG
jgi:hypothetical protein